MKYRIGGGWNSALRQDKASTFISHLISKVSRVSPWAFLCNFFCPVILFKRNGFQLRWSDYDQNSHRRDFWRITCFYFLLLASSSYLAYKWQACIPRSCLYWEQLYLQNLASGNRGCFWSNSLLKNLLNFKNEKFRTERSSGFKKPEHWRKWN